MSAAGYVPAYDNLPMPDQESQALAGRGLLAAGALLPILGAIA